LLYKQDPNIVKLCVTRSQATGKASIDAFRSVFHVKEFVLFNFSWKAIKL
jgi:hypothetical protein